MTVIGIERIRDELSKLKPELKKPWVILDRLPYIHATDDPNAKPYSTPVVGRFDYMESADYIMACNPDAMSNVLSYVASLKAERDAAMKDAERMREALSFYAEGAHFFFNKKEWDAVSGEPRNFWYDKAGTATVEDGTIAKFALSDAKAEGGAG